MKSKLPVLGKGQTDKGNGSLKKQRTQPKNEPPIDDGVRVGRCQMCTKATELEQCGEFAQCAECQEKSSQRRSRIQVNAQTTWIARGFRFVCERDEAGETLHVETLLGRKRTFIYLEVISSEDMRQDAVTLWCMNNRPVYVDCIPNLFEEVRTNG